MDQISKERLVRNLMAALVALAVCVIPASAFSQLCGPGTFPAYADFAAALENPALRLDTLAIAGTRELTVYLAGNGAAEPAILGKPTEQSASSATARCRVAALWTSRGDSLAINWLLDPQIREVEPAGERDSEPSLADGPRPVEHTVRARLVFPAAYRAAIAEARFAAEGEIGKGYSAILVLIDETGEPVISRVLVSSGVRCLDEAALSALMLAVSTPPEEGGTPVAVWYVAPTSWRE